MVLSCTQGRAAAAGGGGGKKEKDPTEALTLTAMRALHQLLAMAGAAGGAAGVAALLQPVAVAGADAAEEAALPPLDGCGCSAAQRTIAERLPLFHHLFQTLVDRRCAKELEPLTCSLQLLAGLLPPSLAGACSRKRHSSQLPSPV